MIFLDFFIYFLEFFLICDYFFGFWRIVFLVVWWNLQGVGSGVIVGGVGNGTPLARFFVAVKTAFFARENGFLGILGGRLSGWIFIFFVNSE